MTDTRDTVRDAARDTGNAINRAMPETYSTMNVAMMVIGAIAIVLLGLYALGVFGTSTTTDTMNETTSQSTTTTPSN
jgi:hypothetical protein